MYATFTAALLGAVQDNPKRFDALQSAEKEPTHRTDEYRRRFVTWCERNFTLQVFYAPDSRMWAYVWTWTDAA